MGHNTALKIRRLKKIKGPNHKGGEGGEKIRLKAQKEDLNKKAARNTKRGGSIYM